MGREKFDEIVNWLRKRGHTVRVEEYEPDEFEPELSAAAYVSGRMITAMVFWNQPLMDGKDRLFADNQRCFDKPWRCPLILELEDIADYDVLDTYLHYLASFDGYKWSNEYEFLKDPRLPRQLPKRERIND